MKPEELAQFIAACCEQQHNGAGAFTPYFSDEYGLDDCVMDGHFNLIELATKILEKMAL